MKKQTSQLTSTEHLVYEKYLRTLPTPKSKTKKKIVVGMIGLVGSLRNVVAKNIAQGIGACLVVADDLRVCLRGKGLPYTHIQKMIAHATETLLSEGHSVVLDTDFVDKKKRAEVLRQVKKKKGTARFVRVISDVDTALGRIVEKPETNPHKDLFAEAPTSWSGKKKGAVVEIREMWRRTPLHYVWNKKNGGNWKLKSLPVFTTIDTTNLPKAKKVTATLISQLKDY